MTHRLDDAVAKLGRAGEHLQNLKVEIDEFLGDDKSYRIANDFESEPDYLIIRAKVISPPPVKMYILLGEILYHCRAALDYLACQLTEANEQLVDENVYWPIVADPNKFGKVGALWPSVNSKIGKMKARHQQMIRDEQPFARWHGQADQDPLTILHELARMDRHRFLHIGQVVANVARVTFGPPEAAARFRRISTTYGPIEKDTEILRYVILQGPKAQVEVKCDVLANIAFSQGGPYATRNILTELAAICARVGEVVQTFLPEFS